MLQLIAVQNVLTFEELFFCFSCCLIALKSAGEFVNVLCIAKIKIGVARNVRFWGAIRSAFLVM